MMKRLWFQMNLISDSKGEKMKKIETKYIIFAIALIAFTGINYSMYICARQLNIVQEILVEHATTTYTKEVEINEELLNISRENLILEETIGSVTENIKNEIAIGVTEIKENLQEKTDKIIDEIKKK